MSEKKGTIVYIGGFEMPDKNAAANRVLNNARVFATIGYKVVFCGIDHFIQQNACKPDIFDGFESWPVKYPTSTKEWIKEQVSFAYIKSVLDKYEDIKFVIGYNMHALPLRNLENWCLKRKIKVLIDATEWYPNKFSLKPAKFIRWIDTNLVMRWYQKKVDGVMAISSLLAEYYKRVVKNVIIVPPLVDLKEEKWKQKNLQRDNLVEFTYTGRAGNGKDIVKDKIDLVINALSEIPYVYNYKFTVVGMTEDDCIAMFPNIKDTIIQLNGKIQFLGRVSHNESIENLMKSDYCIFLREINRQNMAGFPTKFVECLSAGIGFIVNNVSDLGKYFPLDDGILLDNLTEKVVVEAMIDCIEKGKVNHAKSTVFYYKNYIQIIEEWLNNILGTSVQLH